MRVVLLGAVLAVVVVGGCSHPVAHQPVATPSPPGPSASPSVAPPSASPPPAPRSGTGIRGTTVVVGACPVPMEKPCPARPLPVALNIVDLRTNDVVRTVTSAQDGGFLVDLPPGRYQIRPAKPTGPLMSRVAPVTADVHEGAYTTVKLTFQANMQ